MSIEPLVKIESLKEALARYHPDSLAKITAIYKPEIDLVREGLIMRQTIDVESLVIAGVNPEFSRIDLSFIFNKLYNHLGVGPLSPDSRLSEKSSFSNLHLAREDMFLAITSEEGAYGDLGFYVHSRGEPKLLIIPELHGKTKARAAESPLILELYTRCVTHGTKRYELEGYQNSLIRHLTAEKE
jgi:hypothetical protein